MRANGRLRLWLFAITVLVVLLALHPPEKAFAVAELAYDDGPEGLSKNGGGSSVGAGSFQAVRFSIPSTWSGSKLLAARFYKLSPPRASHVRVHVLGSDGITELATPFVFDMRLSNEWNDADLSAHNIMVSGDFYVAIEYLVTNDPTIGYTRGFFVDGRSYYGSPRHWIRFGTYLPPKGPPPADLMIRVLVAIEKLTLTVETEPAEPGLVVAVNGSSMNTDDDGRVLLQLAADDFHTVQVPSEVPIGAGTRMVFVNWTDGHASNSRAINLTTDTTLTAHYSIQYLLTVNSPVGGPGGSGWYDEGSSATFSVTPRVPVEGLMGMLGGKYVLDHWSGDSAATTATASVRMDGPKTVSAGWRTDYTFPYIMIAAITFAAIVIAVMLLFTREEGIRGRRKHTSA